MKRVRKMKIDELLIDFDEMGFAPTTLCENPDEYACEWKRQLTAEIDRLKIHLEQANAGIVNCSGCRLVEINAVKEFAEKVKEKFNGYEATYYNGHEEGFHDLQEEIDELLKEYEK